MKKKFTLEAIASFFVVGLGQIIKGEGDKGLKLILIFYFVLPSAIYASLLFNALCFLIILAIALFSGIILWGYSFWDAFKHEIS